MIESTEKNCLCIPKNNFFPLIVHFTCNIWATTKFLAQLEKKNLSLSFCQQLKEINMFWPERFIWDKFDLSAQLIVLSENTFLLL